MTTRKTRQARLEAHVRCLCDEDVPCNESGVCDESCRLRVRDVCCRGELSYGAEADATAETQEAIAT